MNPSVPGMPGLAPQPGGSRPGASPGDLRRRAHARLAERIDLSRTRHKPLSLVRADGRRTLEQFLDAESPTLSRTERDQFVEDVLAEAVGFGPLEELFRDEAIKEILILGPAVVIARKNDAWLPTSARFRDAEQVRSVLARYAEAGEPVVAGSPSAGGYDVRLANGFRVVAVLPPEVMEVPPLALLIRPAPGTPPPPPSASPSGVVQFNPTVGRPGDVGSRSGIPGSGVILPGSQSGRLPTPVGSGVIPAPTPPAAPPRPVTPPPALTPGPSFDPLAKVRQRLTERIILKFASAGLYDLNQIPLPELRRIVIAHVFEFCEAERLFLDETARERLALEILASMNR